MQKNKDLLKHSHPYENKHNIQDNTHFKTSKDVFYNSMMIFSIMIMSFMLLGSKDSDLSSILHIIGLITFIFSPILAGILRKM